MCTIFTKTQEPPQLSRHQKGYLKQAPCCGCENPIRRHLPHMIYALLLYISQMLPRFSILRIPSFIFSQTGISEWPSSRNILPRAESFCLTLQSIMGISPITWLQTQAIKGLRFHTKSKASSLDEAEKDQSREFLCEAKIARGGGNRKNLELQTNRSSFQITISYREGSKNIKRKAWRICTFGRGSIN